MFKTWMVTLPVIVFGYQNCLVPVEMSGPRLFAGIEQTIKLATAKTRQIGALGPITLRARKAKRVSRVRTAMLFGNYVLDVKRKEIGIFFMKMAVLTAMAGALTNESLQGGIHYSREELAKIWRAFDLRIAMKVPKET
jgi:hypothetical protein